MSKRVSICIITLTILLIFCGFLYYITGSSDDQDERENTTQAAENSESVSESIECDDSSVNDSKTRETANISDEYTNQSMNSDDYVTNEQSEDSELAVNVEVDAAAKYVILPRNGSLVVFYSDGTTEYFDTGIDVMSLPDETIDQVVRGISFASEVELFAFLESYSS